MSLFRCMVWCGVLALASAASLRSVDGDADVKLEAFENSVTDNNNEAVEHKPYVEDNAIDKNNEAVEKKSGGEDNAFDNNNEAVEQKSGGEDNAIDKHNEAVEKKSGGEDNAIDKHNEAVEKKSGGEDNAIDNNNEAVEDKSSGEELPKTDIPVNEKFPFAVQFGSTCGGTIISPTWILTAGHCAISNYGLGVLAGTNNSGDGSGVYREGKRMIIHPLFSVGPYFLSARIHGLKQIAARYDYLLVELEEPLPLDGKTIAAATLNDEEYLAPGLEVGYAGYGAEEQGGYMRSEMHGMELEILDDQVCKSALIEYDPKDMVCTRGRPPRYDSACNGDSGSGLVDANGRLLGVTSWVEGDAVECRNGTLVIFSRVSEARDWIRQITGI